MRPDPGDRALLELANAESRVLVTIDTDFGELIFLHQMAHTGLVRLPDVPAHRRIELMAEIISRLWRESREPRHRYRSGESHPTFNPIDC